MLNIDEIKKFYPSNMHIFTKQLLREYLQYNILDIIFNSKFSNNLIFMGGTAIRIIFNSKRFSEDLDFDNRNMSFDEFKELTNIIKNELSLEGFESEIKTVSKNAFRCYVKFPKLLYNYNLSGYENEKILIQLDAEKQPYNYKKEDYLLNKFAIMTKIFTVPKDILLSQKISAFLNRKRTKGRDIYDIVYLFSFTKPNYDYLEKTNKIKNINMLKQVLLRKCKGMDLITLQKEIEAFLINSKDSKIITMFPKFIKNI